MISRLAFVVFLLSATPLFAEETCTNGTVEEFAGKVSVEKERDGKTVSVPVTAKNTSVAVGLHLVTQSDSWADLRLCDGSALRVGENSDLVLAAARDEGSYWSWAFDLVRGGVYGAVNGGSNGRVKLGVRTPSASMGVRGTIFLFEEKEGATLHTLSGEVLLGPRAGFEEMMHSAKAPSAFVSVPQNRTSSMRKTDKAPAAPKAFDPEELKSRHAALLKAPPQKKADQSKKKKKTVLPNGAPANEPNQETPPPHALAPGAPKSVPRPAAPPSAKPRPKAPHAH